jgi:hypothetical protein
VPAEGLAEIIVRAASTDRLFEAGRTLEASAFAAILPSFDEIDVEARSILGAVLDFTGVDRGRFARAWQSAASGGKSLADAHTGVVATATTNDAERDKLL